MKYSAKDNDMVLAAVLGSDGVAAYAYATFSEGNATVRSQTVYGLRSMEELLVYALPGASPWWRDEIRTVYVPCLSLLQSIIDPYSGKRKKLRPTRLIDTLLEIKCKGTDWNIMPENTKGYGWDKWPEHLDMYRAARKAATETLRAHGMIRKRNPEHVCISVAS